MNFFMPRRGDRTGVSTKQNSPRENRSRPQRTLAPAHYPDRKLLLKGRRYQTSETAVPALRVSRTGGIGCTLPTGRNVKTKIPGYLYPERRNRNLARRGGFR